MNALHDSLLELIRRASAELPDDVHRAIVAAREIEQGGTISRSAMDIIDQNIALARSKSQPICQDTGSIIFYVECAAGLDQIAFEEAARQAVVQATRKGYLRQNSVDSITGKNDGTNLGPGSPTLHFHQHRHPEVYVRLILKGGGCENVGAQYALPAEALKANRDLDGCRKAILDAVLQAQGKGCGPGILGVCIGGDRATGYEFSKQQFLRKLDDHNPDPRTRAAGAGYRRDGQQARDRTDGFRRTDDPVGDQNRSAESPARFLFRECELHVLGLPAARRRARPHRQHRQMALLTGTNL